MVTKKEEVKWEKQNQPTLYFTSRPVHSPLKVLCLHFLSQRCSKGHISHFQRFSYQLFTSLHIQIQC